MWEYFVSALVTLMVTVDPPGLAPIFASLTYGLSPAQRRGVALRAVIIAAAVLAAFALVGEPVLEALGVGLPAFRIAGGLLLFYIAAEMVFERRTRRKSSTADTAMNEDQFSDLAAFPLAIPLMSGPGAITATILLAAQAGGSAARLAALMGVIGLVIGACLAVFLVAGRIERALGRTGEIVLSRLLGVLLAAVAVQFVVDGVLAVARAGP